MYFTSTFSVLSIFGNYSCLEAHYIDEQIHDEDIMESDTVIKGQAVSAAAIVWTNSIF